MVHYLLKWAMPGIESGFDVDPTYKLIAAAAELEDWSDQSMTRRPFVSVYNSCARVSSGGIIIFIFPDKMVSAADWSCRNRRKLA